MDYTFFTIRNSHYQNRFIVLNKQKKMRKSLIILILTTLGFYSYGQNDQSIQNKVIDDVKTIDTITLDENRIYSKTHEFYLVKSDQEESCSLYFLEKRTKP